MNIDDLFPKDPRPVNYTHSFSDGSGNTYFIAENNLSYSPVDPLHSSTGFYSGGDPKNVAITEEDYHSIISLFKKASNNEGIQIENRVKTSGELYFRAEKKSVIIKYGSEENKEIIRLLKKLLAD